MKCVALLLTVLAALAAVSTARLAAQTGVVLTKGPTPTVVDPRLLLSAIGDLTDPNAFSLAAEENIWELTFGVGNAAIPVGPATPNLNFASVVETAIPGGWEICWDDGQIPTTSDLFSVTVRIVADGNVYEMHISVDNQSATLPLTEVEFPRVKVESPAVRAGGDSEDDTLAVPLSQGNVFTNPIVWPYASGFNTLAVAASGSHPGPLSMQWMAYYDRSVTDAPVLFFGTRDPRGFTKDYRVIPYPEPPNGPLGLSFAVAVTPEGDTQPGNDWSNVGRYPAVLGVVRGDYVDAADEYRAWVHDETLTPGERPVWKTYDDPLSTFLEPLAARNSSPIGDKPIPAALENAEIVLTFDGRIADAFLQDRWLLDFDSQSLFYDFDNSVSVVYGWHHFSWPGAGLVAPPWLGDWLPQRGDFMQATKPGDPWIPFLNLENYDELSRSWDDPDQYYAPYSTALLGFANLKVDNWTRRDRSGAQIQSYNSHMWRTCPAAANPTNENFLRAFGSVMTDQARLDGASGVYFDETSQLECAHCYAANHQHPVGGGTPGGADGDYQCAARRVLIEGLIGDMRTAGGSTDYLAASEAPSEVTSDVVQLAFQYTSPDDTVVATLPGVGDIGKFAAPLYALVYHEWQHTARILAVSNNWVVWSGNPDVGYLGPDVTWDGGGYLPRRGLGYATWFGDIPSGGSTLGPDYKPDLAQNRAAFPQLVKHGDLLKNVIAVVKNADVRPTYHNGRRLRDPVTTVATIPPEGSIYDSFVAGEGALPLVYSSAWQDTESDSFSLMFVNWTSAGDMTPAGTAFGGPQSFDVTIDASRMGFAPVVYSDLKIVTPAGSTSFGSFDLTSGSVTFPVFLDELSCACFVLTP